MSRDSKEVKKQNKTSKPINKGKIKKTVVILIVSAMLISIAAPVLMQIL